MADLGKNGYSWSGYTEPFIVPDGMTLNNGTALDSLGAIPIEKTEYRNSMLYFRALETITSNTIHSKDMNFDTRSDVNTDTWVLDIDGTEVRVMDVSYNNVEGYYIIFLSGNVQVDAGKAYRVTKRFPDVGNTVASRTYQSGERVAELYVASGGGT